MNFLFIDDHQIFREGVIPFIEELAICDKLHTAESVSQAKEALRTQKIDVLILDLNLNNEDGREVIDFSKGLETFPRIMCLTMEDDLNTLFELFSCGILGYVTKNSGLNELIRCIEGIVENRIFVDQAMLKRLVTSASNNVRFPNSVEILTNREYEIFNRLVSEDSVQEIATKLFISERTVENHRTSIYRKLNVKDRFSLMRYAKENKLK